VCWPRLETFGGAPCHIGVKFFNMCESISEILKICPSNTERDQCIFLATHCQRAMQAQVDELVAKGHSGLTEAMGIADSTLE